MAEVAGPFWSFETMQLPAARVFFIYRIFFEFHRIVHKNPGNLGIIMSTDMESTP